MKLQIIPTNLKVSRSTPQLLLIRKQDIQANLHVTKKPLFQKPKPAEQYAGPVQIDIRDISV